jgi:transposase
MAEKKVGDKIDKRAEARQLYLTQRFEQKQICAILGVGENTFTRWKKEGRWDDVRGAQSSGKERFSQMLMEQIMELDKSMMAEGRKLMTSKEVNSLWQLQNMLRKVEETGNLTAKVTVISNFTDWIRARYPADLKRMAQLADEFIMEALEE